MSYKDTVDKGLGIVNKVLVDLIVNELTAVYGDSWWSVCVLGKLKNANSLPRKGDTKSLAGSLDVLSCVYVIRSNKESFDSVLEFKQYKALDDILDARNESAHCGINGMTDRDAMRHLDAMERFCRPIDVDSAEEILTMWNAVNNGGNPAQPIEIEYTDAVGTTSETLQATSQEEEQNTNPTASPSPTDPDMAQKSKKKILSDELGEFRDRVLEQAASKANENETSVKSEFVSIVADDIAQAGGCSGFSACPYSSTVSKRRKAEIEGFSIDDYGTVSIFACIFNGTPDPVSVGRRELEDTAKHALLFLTEALTGEIKQYIAKGDPAMDAADSLYAERGTIDSVKIHVITDNIWSNRLEEAELADVDGLKVMINPVDIQRFRDQMLTHSEHREFNIDLSKFGVDGVPCLKASFSEEVRYNSYLCAMPAQLLSDLFDRYRGELLESNVRSYLGRKKNLYIKGTVVKAPDMFFAYNNGITATATHVGVEESDGGMVIKSLRSFQIVNGGQTTVTLFDADKVDGSDLSKVSVMMKLIEIPCQEDQNELVPKISRAANTQLKVQDADFLSNHPFHKKMHTLSITVCPNVSGRARNSYWFYENARGQHEQEYIGKKGKEKSQFEVRFPKDQVVSKMQMAQYRVWYNGFPYVEEQKNAFKKFMSDIGNEFGNDMSWVNSTYFKESIGLVILFRGLEDILLHQTWSPKKYKPQFIRYTVAKVADILDRQGRELDLMKLWNEQAIPVKLIKPLEDVGREVWDVLKDDVTRTDSHKWLRSQGCWATVRDADIRISEDLGDYTMTKTEHDLRLSKARKNEKSSTRKDARKVVDDMGQMFWKKAYEWAVRNEALDDKKDLTLLQKASMEMPTPKECDRLLEIADDLDEKGFVFR